MRVRIKSCAGACFWYAGEIGSIFDVVDRGSDFVLAEDYNNPDKKAAWRHIDKTDCEEIKMVRAKFVVQSVANGEIKLACEYSPEVPEDQAFVLATPWGEISMSIDNPVALEQFEAGKAFYVDFTPVD